ncbi:MAG: T9SS type A sorting domain-containing protein [Bacteroidales bacterium]|nr:T9SS type A sorting domain-containing protein [Bacteroidales bacterium]
MKKSLLTLLVLMLFGSVYAQIYDPNSYYQTTMVEQGIMTLHGNNSNFVGEVYIDGVPSDNLDLEIGCYDIQDPNNIHLVGGMYGLMESGGVQYEHPHYFLTVYGETGDRIIFKLYDHASQQELDYVCLEEYFFTADDVMLGYIWHFFSQGEEMHFIGQGDWNDIENWQNADRLPMALDDVIIDEGAVCHMPESAIGQYASLTIEDGAQLYAPEDAEVFATVKKNIAKYTSGEGNNWYLLSFPVDVEGDPDFNAAGMITSSAYDLFYFDQNFPGEVVDETSENGEWRNYKYYMSNGLEFKAPYNAYLYANNQNTTLHFTGNLCTAGSVVYQRITFNNGSDQVGVNLVGNPYTCNAEMVAGNRIGGYYMLNDERNDVIVYDDGEFDYTYLEPLSAFFAVASANNNNAKITLSPLDVEAHDGEEPGIIRSNVSTMSIELTANGILKDRVYVKAGEGENCIKFNLSNNSSKIFVPQNNKNYAIAYTEGANVMPICFTTKESGIYTLNFNTKRMNCSYLHLIDNVTGTDIDLFQTPSYTFNSSDSNYANRFKLVFSEEATNEIAESFAFISNGELMINNSGNATLQVMDITGRILSTETIQNCYSKSLNLSSGVYVVRLSNGNDVKAQKIVVE